MQIEFEELTQANMPSFARPGGKREGCLSNQIVQAIINMVAEGKPHIGKFSECSEKAARGMAKAVRNKLEKRGVVNVSIETHKDDEGNVWMCVYPKEA